MLAVLKSLFSGFLRCKVSKKGGSPKESSDNGRVYIPFDLHTSVGGPATFLKNLQSYLDRVHFPYTADAKRAGIIFFPISYDLNFLRKFKKNGGLICQRLDGVYYPEKHGPEFESRNYKIKEIYTNLADKVVFQSEYSRQQCFAMFGPLHESAYTVIHNGVDTDIFFPDPEKRWNADHIHFCTTGNFRNNDMLVPVVEALDRLKADYTFSLHVVGPIKDEQCAEAVKRDYVIQHGSQSMLQIAEILRNSDIFIYSHLNPPCPNSVLEAIASGLPVAGFRSGAMAELLPGSQELLAEVNNHVFHQYSEFHPELLAGKIEACIKDFAKYREISLQACNDYFMDKCGQKYVETFKKMAGLNS